MIKRPFFIILVVMFSFLFCFQALGAVTTIAGSKSTVKYDSVQLEKVFSYLVPRVQNGEQTGHIYFGKKGDSTTNTKDEIYGSLSGEIKILSVNPLKLEVRKIGNRKPEYFTYATKTSQFQGVRADKLLIEGVGDKLKIKTKGGFYSQGGKYRMVCDTCELELRPKFLSVHVKGQAYVLSRALYKSIRENTGTTWKQKIAKLPPGHESYEVLPISNLRWMKFIDQKYSVGSSSFNVKKGTPLFSLFGSVTRKSKLGALLAYSYKRSSYVEFMLTKPFFGNSYVVPLHIIEGQRFGTYLPKGNLLLIGGSDISAPKGWQRVSVGNGNHVLLSPLTRSYVNNGVQESATHSVRACPNTIDYSCVAFDAPNAQVQISPGQILANSVSPFDAKKYTTPEYKVRYIVGSGYSKIIASTIANDETVSVNSAEVRIYKTVSGKKDYVRIVNSALRLPTKYSWCDLDFILNAMFEDNQKDTIKIECNAKDHLKLCKVNNKNIGLNCIKGSSPAVRTGAIS